MARPFTHHGNRVNHLPQEGDGDQKRKASRSLSGTTNIDDEDEVMVSTAATQLEPPAENNIMAATQLEPPAENNIMDHQNPEEGSGGNPEYYSARLHVIPLVGFSFFFESLESK